MARERPRSVRRCAHLVAIGERRGKLRVEVVGNLGDRVFRSHSGFLQGSVVDWINFQWWPVFNVADACICIGAVLLGFVAVFAPIDHPDGDGSESADEVAAA